MPDDVHLVPNVTKVVPDGTGVVPDGIVVQWLLTIYHMLVPDGMGVVPDGTCDAAGRLFSLFNVLFISRIILFLFR